MVVIGIDDLKKFSKEEQQFIINYGSFRIERYMIDDFDALCVYMRSIYELDEIKRITKWLSTIKKKTFLGYMCVDEIFICGEDNTPIPPRFLKQI